MDVYALSLSAVLYVLGLTRVSKYLWIVELFISYINVHVPSYGQKQVSIALTVSTTLLSQPKKTFIVPPT